MTTQKKIIQCPKCSQKVRVPSGKHVAFVCPKCNEHLEYDDRTEEDKISNTVVENMEGDSEVEIGMLGYLTLISLSVLVAIPLTIGLYQYFSWIPIISIEIKIIITFILLGLLVYYVTYRNRVITLIFLFVLILFMGYNQYFNQGGLTLNKAIKGYLLLVEHKFEKNPNLIRDIENSKILSVESEIIKSADYNTPEIKQFANKASIAFFTESDDYLYRNYGDLIRFFSLFKYINQSWKYVSDPVEDEHFAKASESIHSMAGDCDDHAILMATCIKAIGGQSRIVWIEAHAFPIVLVAKDKYEYYLNVKPLIFELFEGVEDENFGVVQTSEGIWLSLDYTAKYPGGPFINTNVIKLIEI